LLLDVDSILKTAKGEEEPKAEERRGEEMRWDEMGSDGGWDEIFWTWTTGARPHRYAFLLLMYFVNRSSWRFEYVLSWMSELDVWAGCLSWMSELDVWAELDVCACIAIAPASSASVSPRPAYPVYPTKWAARVLGSSLGGEINWLQMHDLWPGLSCSEGNKISDFSCQN
jgi:hypothetical protein